MQQYLILIAIIIISIVGKNTTVAVSASILLIIRLITRDTTFHWIDKYGVKAGIIILTIAVMAPIASGKISFKEIIATGTSLQGIIAVAVGIMVAYLGGRGVNLLATKPQAVTGLVIGTVVGVAFFKGVPVGPLIGAGLLSLFLSMSS